MQPLSHLQQPGRRASLTPAPHGRAVYDQTPQRSSGQSRASQLRTPLVLASRTSATAAAATADVGSATFNGVGSRWVKHGRWMQGLGAGAFCVVLARSVLRLTRRARRPGISISIGIGSIVALVLSSGWMGIWEWWRRKHRSLTASSAIPRPVPAQVAALAVVSPTWMASGKRGLLGECANHPAHQLILSHAAQHRVER
jgi:hypothetical protein